MSGTPQASPVCPSLQGRAPTDPCVRDPGRYHDKAAGRCCYRCPAGEWDAGAAKKRGLGSGKDGSQHLSVLLVNSCPR